MPQWLYTPAQLFSSVGGSLHRRHTSRILTHVQNSSDTLPLLLHRTFAFLTPSNSQRISWIKDFITIDVVNIRIKHLSFTGFKLEAVMRPTRHMHQCLNSLHWFTTSQNRVNLQSAWTSQWLSAGLVCVLCCQRKRPTSNRPSFNWLIQPSRIHYHVKLHQKPTRSFQVIGNILFHQYRTSCQGQNSRQSLITSRGTITHIPSS